MESFRWISVVLSMILGLGITRMLTGLVAIFRARRQAAVDWVPLAWAVCIFLVQLQYWWAINNLPAMVTTFSFPEFVALTLLTILLFTSASLLFPSTEADGHLRDFFQNEGRWALVSLSTYIALGAIANWFFFRQSPIALWGALDIPLIVLPLIVFWSRSRRIDAAITLLYLPLCIYDTLLSST